jgi:hypothetical protein
VIAILKIIVFFPKKIAILKMIINRKAIAILKTINSYKAIAILKRSTLATRSPLNRHNKAIA